MTDEMISNEVEDHPIENCAVFGIYAPELPIASTISLALIALQHRGQEACGIVTYDEKAKQINTHKGIGLVSQVFNTEEVFRPLSGSMGIGHTRYSTAGRQILDNVQPVVVQTYHGPLAISQNGNLTTHKSLRGELLKKGLGMFRDSDIEVIAQMLSLNPPDYDEKKGPEWEKRIQNFLHQSDGAYSLVLMTKDAIFGTRDHCGFRPLCIGEIQVTRPDKSQVTRYVLASETCALYMVGATYLREVKPGEIVRIDENGLTSNLARQSSPALCIFEYVYFSRPDSMLLDQLVVSVRERLGTQLAKESPANADIVVSVPDSSTPAAIGYAKQSGIPYVEGIAKNRYVHRTFIQPTQTLRKLGVSMKFTPIYEKLKGKRIVLVDDSIVRGNTIENIVVMLRNAGVTEVHVRVSSPPIRHPCYMGIDMSTPQQMVAHGKDIDEICKAIGADSLAYLSHKGMEDAVSEGVANKQDAGYCGACFTGKYPVKVDDW